MLLFYIFPAAIRLQKYSSDPPHFPAAIAMISHGSPTDSRIRLENVGSAFKVSARDMARQPVNIHTLTPPVRRKICPNTSPKGSLTL